MFNPKILRTVTLLVAISASGMHFPGANFAGEQTPTRKNLMAEEAYQNIQVLKGIPSSQVQPIMNLMSASLGVDCSECHRPGDYDKDVKASKEIARKMLRMVFQINKTHFNGRPQVTCNSCHRGQKQPIAMAEVFQAGLEKNPTASIPDSPAIGEILERYARAVGGRARFEKFTSCELKGLSIPQNYPIEIRQVEPNRMSIVTRLASGPVRSEAGPSEMKNYEYLLHPIRFVEKHRNPRIVGKMKIRESEAYEVAATTDGLAVRLFFDARNGLLLRRTVIIKNTVLGPIPVQTDYEDYRDIDGAKIPFVARESGLTRTGMFKLTEIKRGVSDKSEHRR